VLDLAIGSGVVHRSPVHPDVPSITEIQELSIYELIAIIRNYMIWNLEPKDYVLDELCCTLRLEVDDGPDLDPPGELVNGDQEAIGAPEVLLEVPTMSRHQTTNGQMMGIV
jgi:hypothetical protein